jgi:PAS domain S-box-containing protein
MVVLATACGSLAAHALAAYEGLWWTGLSDRWVTILQDVAVILLLAVLGAVIVRLRRCAQDAEEASARYREVLEAAADGLLGIDDRGRCSFVSRKMSQLLGYQPGELLGRPLNDVLPQLALTLVRPGREAQAPRVTPGIPESVREMVVRRKDGSEKALESRVGPPLPTSTGLCTTLILRDVTPNRQTRELLCSREAHLRLIVEQMPAILWTTDTELRITSTLGGGLAALNLRPMEVIGMSMLECLEQDNPEATPIAAHLKAVRGQSLSYEMEWKGHTFQVRVDPLRNSARTIIGTVGILLDVTERKQTLADLKARERQQAAVAALGLRALTGLPLDALMNEVAAAVCQTLGVEFCKVLEYAPDERMFRWGGGAGWKKAPGSISNLRECQAGYTLRRGEPVIVRDLALETRFHSSELLQSHGAVSGISTVIREQHGALGVVGAFTTRRRDFTQDDIHFLQAVANVLGASAERRHAEEAQQHLEEQLRQAQKMEAIGRLAGGVAHDFNNLLCVINGYADFMVHQLSEDKLLREYAEQIQRAGERAASLTRQLLAFSRKQMLVLSILNLNALVAETDKMLRRLIGEDIELSTSLDPILHPIRADAGQVEQVLLNLAVNARDAMPKGGRLTISTKNVHLDPAGLQQRPEIPPGPYVLLAVSDTGCGMDSAVKARLFEPFFTTKEVGKGTGLGLATVYGIIKQSGGHIEVDSEPGQGTTFRIYLPRHEQAAPVPKQAAAPSSARGTETILLVEDEEGVRSLARRALEERGYTVLVACDGKEALAIGEQHQEPIHLLLTDAVMPNLSGGELASAWKSTRPQTRVVFMSGFTESALIQHGVLTGETECIFKPFTPDSLTSTVRRVLDDQPTTLGQLSLRCNAR